MLPHLSHKQPKIIAATLVALKGLYHAYGCKIVDPKPVLKALPKVFGHADKNVRAAAQELTVEFYRWLKDAIKPVFWGDLKPVQQTDLEKLFEKAKEEPAPKQERFTRAQQAAMAEAEAAPAAEGGDGEAGGEDLEGDYEEVDAFDLAEPQDVLSKAPADLHEKLGSSKWKDRKEALEALFAVVNVPRIKEGPFDELIRALAKCMKDANIMVVIVAANCVEAIAKGLRKGFGKYRSTIMGPMMERLKEKKQNVADALGAGLDAVFVSTSLSECLEEVLEFLKHKNPQVKLESLKFLIRCLRTTRDVPAKPEVKSIADAGTKLLTESTEVTRSAGAELLGTLMKIMGERAMNPYLEGLDDIRKTKIKEYFDTAQVKAKDRPKPIAPPPKAAAPPKKVLGGKKPMVKKVAPAAAPPPPVQEPEPEPPKAKPTLSKGPSSRLGAPGGLKKPGLAGPSTLQKKLGGPGGIAAPSPRRVVSAAPPPEEEPEPAPAPPKLGLGRGLTGRSLGKPGLQSMNSAPSIPAAAPVQSGMSSIERAELEELRAEKERMKNTIEHLRSETSNLHTRISELQNQNAELIEECTHQKLTITAKETQLVRARADAESAEQTVQTQNREMERLKRELARSARAAANAPINSPVGDGLMEYGGMGGYGDGMYPPDAGYQRPGVSSRFDRPRSYMTSPSEEKENASHEGFASPTGSISGRDRFSARKTGTSNMSMTSSGRGSPTMGMDASGSTSMRASGELRRADSLSSRGGSTSRPAGGMRSASGGEPENWKRAAEVTSQLKARIEQMKVRSKE